VALAISGGVAAAARHWRIKSKRARFGMASAAWRRLLSGIEIRK
jgi:hypothetical protein